MFKEIVGHKEVLKYLEALSISSRRSHAYLFIGPEGVGKTTIARCWAGRLLNSSQPLSIHPDYHEVVVGGEMEIKPIDAIRVANEFVVQKPFIAGLKVILLRAEQLSENASDAFLKTLEEPQGHRLIILTAQHQDVVASTIASRCQKVNFGLVADEDLDEWIQKIDPHLGKEARVRILHMSVGRPGLVCEFLKDTERLADIQETQHALKELLRSPISERMRWIQSVFAPLKKDLKIREKKAHEVIGSLEHVLHEECIGGNQVFLKTNKLLRQTRDALEHNVSPQLAVEYLLMSL